VSPLAHLLGSWLIASVTTDNPRDRKLVTLAGILPDADGLGLIVDAANAALSGQEISFQYYQHYHHYLLHGWPGAIAVATLLAGFANQKGRVLLACLLTFHLHLLCDLIGSRGPSPEDLWPIAYGEPISRHPIWFWKGQWRLDGWQNRWVLLLLFVGSLWLAAKRGYSVLELAGRRWDSVFVGVLQKWQRQLARKPPTS